MTLEKREIFLLSLFFLISAFCVGNFLLKAIGHFGGFVITPNSSFGFVDASNFKHNLSSVFFGLLNLSGGNIFGSTLTNLAALMSIVRVGGLCLVLYIAWRSLARFYNNPFAWDIRAVLGASVIINIVSCCFADEYRKAGCCFSNSHMLPFDVAALEQAYTVRYLSPTILFGSVLAAIELPGMLKSIGNIAQRRFITASILSLCLVNYLIFLGTGIKGFGETAAIKRESSWIAGNWLRTHGYTNGVGSYNESLSTTAFSDQTVQVLAYIEDRNGKIGPYNWVANMNWYKNEKPQFVLFSPNNPDNINAATISAAFGPPLASENVAGLKIALLKPPLK